MSEKPLLSVVIPAYNYAATLPRAVESVLAQLQEADADLLVIDDGSTDQTPTVLAELQARHPGRFRMLRKENGGLASVRNRGIDEARGDYLIFLDADDEMAPGALAVLAAHLAANPQSRLVIGAHCSVLESGKQSLHKADMLPASAAERVYGYLIGKTLSLSNGACAMHRDVFVPGRYPEQFRSVEDIPVFAQVLARFPCSVVEQPLALIHKHSTSLRHNLTHARAVGLSLVDEVFSPARMPAELQGMKAAFRAQRCLSLFRTFQQAGEYQTARGFYLEALRTDWRVLFKLSYTRKALRLWLNSKKKSV
ncbi:glycosyltransferase family 2 protein [Pseudomonas sp. Gutcm_11s]|uniref:glycosyltransferase family 2 protein n=1 Tax=Pseudomonas sp. Gutcm_11s TaxID=3026088 RepID=UPI00236025D6|nr:glycosyltransferase family A protein [Pseudomonas sp. Gutcm_11s]MDD0842929.1 glycosyltransferase family A protein [Pseudomonas sp. Gutcm_11s]